jgi:hypothetical protein
MLEPVTRVPDTVGAVTKVGADKICDDTFDATTTDSLKELDAVTDATMNFPRSASASA